MKVHVIFSADEGNEQTLEGVVSKESIAKKLCKRGNWWYRSYKVDDKYPQSLLTWEKDYA